MVTRGVVVVVVVTGGNECGRLVGVEGIEQAAVGVEGIEQVAVGVERIEK